MVVEHAVVDSQPVGGGCASEGIESAVDALDFNTEAVGEGLLAWHRGVGEHHSLVRGHANLDEGCGLLVGAEAAVQNFVCHLCEGLVGIHLGSTCPCRAQLLRVFA